MYVQHTYGGTVDTVCKMERNWREHEYCTVTYWMYSMYVWWFLPCIEQALSIQTNCKTSRPFTSEHTWWWAGQQFSHRLEGLAVVHNSPCWCSAVQCWESAAPSSRTASERAHSGRGLLRQPRIQVLHQLLIKWEEISWKIGLGAKPVGSIMASNNWPQVCTYVRTYVLHVHKQQLVAVHTAKCSKLRTFNPSWIQHKHT